MDDIYRDMLQSDRAAAMGFAVGYQSSRDDEIKELRAENEELRSILVNIQLLAAC